MDGDANDRAAHDSCGNKDKDQGAGTGVGAEGGLMHTDLLAGVGSGTTSGVVDPAREQRLGGLCRDKDFAPAAGSGLSGSRDDNDKDDYNAGADDDSYSRGEGQCHGEFFLFHMPSPHLSLPNVA